jgi:AraC-like DNA-binding protein
MLDIGLCEKILRLRERCGSAGDGASIPFLGWVVCREEHRLRAVSMPKPAAVLVAQGEKRLYWGEDSMLVRPGEMFLLPARAELNVHNRPDPKHGRYLAFCLVFDEETLARVAAGQAPAGRAEGAPRLTPEAFRVRMDAVLSGSFAHLVDMALLAPRNERLLGLCLEEVLTLIAERSSLFPLFWSSASSWSARCANLISQDPGRAWRAADIAGRLAVSERNLRRCLEAEGVSLRKILQEVRLNAGLSLLQEGRVSVGEAAYRCGYDSASKFAGRFHERFGVHPSQVLRFNADSEPFLAG